MKPDARTESQGIMRKVQIRIMDRFNLDGKTAIIFGGSGGGMGTQVTLALAEAGANVVVADITDGRVTSALEEVKGAGGDGVGAPCDVRKAEDLDNIFALAKDAYGHVDVVVNLVGGARIEGAGGTERVASMWNPLHVYTPEDWRSIFALNVDYVYETCHRAAHAMIEQGHGGTIVNFSSVSALAGSPYNAPYGAAKAAVLSLTRSIALELGEYGIRANCIVPGSVPTPLAKSANPKAFAAVANRAGAKSPLGRQVDPAEIANAVLFLAGPASSGITGQSLNVDVGASANSPLGTWHDYRESMRIRHAERNS